MQVFDVEYTDTFAGEANYCWVKRASITVEDDASTRDIMIAARAAVGLTGTRGKLDVVGDGYEYRPANTATILFVTFGAYVNEDAADNS